MTGGNSDSDRSLFGEILDWMLAPLLFVWPLSIAFTHYFAHNVASYPYDQALRDRVAAVARQVKQVNGKPSLALPESARALLRADETDSVYFRVATRSGRFIVGDQDLPMPELAASEPPVPGEIYLRDGEYKDKSVRLAYTLLAETLENENSQVLVEVAETTEKRNQMANKIVASVILPQFIIIPLAVLLVWFGLSRGLRPLNRLRRTIETRDPGDLSPIATHRVPEELEPLVDAFNAMFERMKRNSEVQQRFIADAAHQMRTPLTGLKTQAQFAMRESDPETLRHALQQIATGVDRAGRLINQLLTLARAEGGSEPAPPHGPVDLDLLLREVIANWVAAAFDKGIDLGFESVGPAPISGQAFLLRELANNLIDNALRYTPGGGHVTCRLISAADSIRLEIEDDGIGISEAQSELVFERFYRVDDAHTEGSGLGLSIVAEIAAQHNARASLKPNPQGRGSIARVIFPPWQPAKPAATTEHDITPPAPPPNR
ncbi:MAG: sensor histidine kinase N-terminal domain-containing protein [Azonexus sp.]|jgi:two-component system sensor histidine kinase TctE|nr:sensor histidine kinase N-terminal domain-containing protein [Azonexus sp.]